MRVICINNGPRENQIGEINSAPELTEGKVYIVRRELDSAYELEGIRTPLGYSGYNKSRFIPCSDIDEMELQKKKELSIANLFKWL